MPNNQSFTIDKVGWHTNTPGNPESLQEIEDRFRIIIAFLQSNGFTLRTILGIGAIITDELTISSADLTDDGLTLMKKCYDKWLKRVDKGMPPEDLTIFQKELAKMQRNESPDSKTE